MTEDEAKAKWCPFVRRFDADGRGGATSTNRPLYLDGEKRRDLNCIASGCMAWRTTPANHQGYCGLAGTL